MRFNSDQGPFTAEAFVAVDYLGESGEKLYCSDEVAVSTDLYAGKEN